MSIEDDSRAKAQELDQTGSEEQGGLLRRLWDNPYEKPEGCARRFKIVLQFALGGALVAYVILRCYTVWVNNTSHDLLTFWDAFDSKKFLTDPIADALLISTAIELGYLFFTDGPDEAIHPLITGTAAIFLFRLPDQGISSIDAVNRSVELGIYILILATLLLIRTHYERSERERRQAVDEEMQKKKPRRKTKNSTKNS